MAVLLQYALTSNTNPTTVGADVEGTAALNFTAGNPDPENYRTHGGFATDPALQLYPVSGATSAANAYGAGGYVQFALSSAAGKVLNLTSVAFKGAKNGASARGWAMRCSVDSYAANIGGADFATAKTTWSDLSIDLSGEAYQGLASITFRFCVYGPDSSYSSWFDDITVNGTVDASGTTYAVDGAAAASSAVSAAVTGQRPAAGAAAVVSGASAAVTAQCVTAGAAAAVSGASAAVTAQLPTSGTVAGTSAVGGTVARSYAAAGSVAGVSGAAGAVTASLPSAGTVAGQSTVSGSVTASRPAAGTAAAVSGVDGAVFCTYPVSGQVDAVSGAAGAVSVAAQSIAVSGVVAGVANARCGVASAVTVKRAASGTVSAAAAIIAASTALRVAAGIAAAASGASADPFIKGKSPAAGTVYVVSGTECDAQAVYPGRYPGRHRGSSRRAYGGASGRVSGGAQGRGSGRDGQMRKPATSGGRKH